MNMRLLILCLPFLLTACATTVERGTLAELHSVRPELTNERVDVGLDEAMEGYRRFVETTPERMMPPEAIQRFADLTIEKEYGYIDGAAPTAEAANTESDQAFEERVAQGEKIDGLRTPQNGDDLKNAEAEKAVEMYQRLLEKYPLYQGNEQVMYQLSRAYEELGQVDEAMAVLDRFTREYPASSYMDEVQFRRGEYRFSRKKYAAAEQAYQSVVAFGEGSTYYEFALYKLGWSLYKQEFYEEALQHYLALLDYKVSTGTDLEQDLDKGAAERIDDTFRVISLCFSNLGGAEVVSEYFARHGKRRYEDKVYLYLGEFYLDKRRYNDAAEVYRQFVALHPFDARSPDFSMRVIEIYRKGGFGRLVLEAKKEFTQTYALDSKYWEHFDIHAREDVVELLKVNHKDLANHYHALYQDKRHAKEKEANYAEALRWYRSFLASFPNEPETPALNYQMADLMLEAKHYLDAAIAYEKTAYHEPRHEKSADAGYAAVYAYREYLKVVAEAKREQTQQDVVISSLRFAETFPEHEKAAIVLSALADNLYEMKHYELAASTAGKLIETYPDADRELMRSAWLVEAHGSFEQAQYAEAENGYLRALALMDEGDAQRPGVQENLAAAIYKQGEEANRTEEYQTAADHFLRLGVLAPQAGIRANAEYDGAEALIRLQEWERAAQVLQAFRANFPGHPLQGEVTKKLARVYGDAGKPELAALEYERIERESDDQELSRGALLMAAELYKQNGDRAQLLTVYQRYVASYPRPLEPALEIYNEMAVMYRDLGEEAKHLEILHKMVDMDKVAGDARTDRTRYIGAKAALLLTEPLFDEFTGVTLSQPLKKNLKTKKDRMRVATDGFTRLLDYEVLDVTAAATYYMAEIYYHFSRALMESERPQGLGDLELEQYEIALEEQSYPFEEKAIDVHTKNVELLRAGHYSAWIDHSIEKLALLYPARFARVEEHTGIVDTLGSYRYPPLEQPLDAVDEVSAEAAGTTMRDDGSAMPEVGEGMGMAEPVDDAVPADTGSGVEPQESGGDEQPAYPDDSDLTSIL